MVIAGVITMVDIGMSAMVRRRRAGQDYRHALSARPIA
jgi:hypothetical protein